MSTSACAPGGLGGRRPLAGGASGSRPAPPCYAGGRRMGDGVATIAVRKTVCRRKGVFLDARRPLRSSVHVGEVGEPTKGVVWIVAKDEIQLCPGGRAYRPLPCTSTLTLLFFRIYETSAQILCHLSRATIFSWKTCTQVSDRARTQTWHHDSEPKIRYEQMKAKYFASRQLTELQA